MFVVSAAVAALTLGPSNPASSQILGINLGNLLGIGNLRVIGNQVTGILNLPGISADLGISFGAVRNLNPNSIGITARLVNPLDPSLLARLPKGGLIGIPVAFPVLSHITPPPAGGLAFAGTYDFGLHVENLIYLPQTPLRLFSAPDGGAFQDITEDMGSGSYRVRGCKGTFSDFLIVLDLRSTASVVQTKFTNLTTLLAGDHSAIAPALLTQLENQVALAQSQYTAGHAAQASQTLATFISTVQSKSGTVIPDVWAAGTNDVNVAGILESAASTLRFSLSLLP
jgi:hypothetical protein